MNLVTFYDYLEDTRILAQQNERIAIHACLEEILVQGVKVKPKLIVELGVSKEALANKVLGYIARLFDSNFISCDLYDFSNVQNYEKWHFIQSDDIRFGRNFSGFCLSKSIEPFIDLLFIDTDELYDHVKKEIEIFFPLLSFKGMVMFRCSNLKKYLCYPDGKTTSLGWDNERGVIRVIEEIIGDKFDETNLFEGTIGDWAIKHVPWGAGLTVMRKI